MRKHIYILFLLIIAVTGALAQEVTVTGTVTDVGDGTTIPGVNILVKGTYQGTITDIDGKYRINVPRSGAVLVFSFIGYTSQEIPVGNQTVINVILAQESKLLDEIVVIGYGTVRKSDLTGAVGSIKSDDLTKITAINPVQSLQGRISGVQVTNSTGAPGTSPIVRVRGVGTFNESSPIYVVDGVIVDNISFLNSADIASMEVLKDASATAIYGSRGANGVILVTTKSGKIGEEKTVFSYNGEFGIQTLAKKIDLLNGREYAIIANRIRPGSYNNIDAVPNTDWQDLIFRNAVVTNHQVSATGSTKSTQYYVGLGYFKQEGIVEKSNYERITLKFNNTYNLSKILKFGNNITLTPYKQRNAPAVVYNAYRALPVLNAYRPDGTFSGVPGVGNPLADLAYSNSYNKGVRAVGNIFGDIAFSEALHLHSSLGIDGAFNKDVSFTPAFQVLYYDGSPSMQYNLLSDLNKGNFENMMLLWENTLHYDMEIDKHNISALAGYTMQDVSSEKISLAGEDILRDTEDFWYINGNYVYVKDKIDKLNDIKNEVDAGLNYSMISYLFRINYTYDNRYIFTATYRRDGSSKFAKGNRYGDFPSFALGWNIAREAFMKDVKSINTLKLRTSWGKIGNEKIPYSNRFSLTQTYLAVLGIGDISYPALTYAKSGNPDLTWETTTQFDIGLEAATFNGRLTGEFDYYHRKTADILIDLSTPGHMGNGQGQKVTYNAAEVLNTGFEANVGWRDKMGDLSYGFGIMGTLLHNEVLTIGGSSGVDSLLYGGNFAGFLTLSREGLPIGEFYGYKTDGIFQNQAELDAYPHDSQAGIGDLRRVDVNGDGIINGEDRTNLGSSIPKFIFGFHTELGFRNFDLAIHIQGQTGNKIFNAKEFIRPDSYNYEKHVSDAWNGEGTGNDEPRPSLGGYNYVPSDKFIQDGSFVRLRSVVIGYTLPAGLARRLYTKTVRFYIKGDNIYTLTKFTGYTPEVASGNVLENGIDMGIYPISAVYSIGINLTF